MGVFPIEKALEMAREKNLDLVQVTEKANPTVCKITDYGKYLYWEKKKEKEKKSTGSAGEMKGIRLRFAMSPHDMEVRAKSAINFLNKGHKVKIELVLRGRQKAQTLSSFAEEKLNSFFELLEKEVSIKKERETKKEGRGLTMVISKKQ